MRLKNPIISVIMPVYNAENTLEQAVGSILKQSFKDFELLLIDDGSTDNSGNLCDNFMKNDSRIKVYHLQNGGVANAKNFALDKIQGEYFCICDSDDYYEKNFLMDGLSAFSNNNIDIFASGIIEEFIKNDIIIKQTRYSVEKNFISTQKEVLENFGYTYPNCIITASWGKIYRTSIVKKHTIKHENFSLGEDSCFNFDYLKHANKVYLSKNIYYHYRRINPNSLYSKLNKNIYTIISTIFKKRQDATLVHSCNDNVLKRITNEKVVALISCIHKYYANANQTSKRERKTLIKKISHDPAIRDIKTTDLKRKVIEYLFYC